MYNINISTFFRLLVADAWDVQLEFRNFFTKNNIIYNLSEMLLPISTKITLVLFLLVKTTLLLYDIQYNGEWAIQRRKKQTLNMYVWERNSRRQK